MDIIWVAELKIQEIIEQAAFFSIIIIFKFHTGSNKYWCCPLLFCHILPYKKKFNFK